MNDGKDVKCARELRRVLSVDKIAFQFESVEGL